MEPKNDEYHGLVLEFMHRHRYYFSGIMDWPDGVTVARYAISESAIYFLKRDKRIPNCTWSKNNKQCECIDVQ